VLLLHGGGQTRHAWGGTARALAEDRHFLELAPHARYADVSGAGHMVAGDRNDRFTRAVREFLREVRSRSGGGRAISSS